MVVVVMFGGKPGTAGGYASLAGILERQMEVNKAWDVG